MLFRKMLRDLKGNLGQFIAVLLLSALSVSMFIVMRCSDIGAYRAFAAFEEETDLADGWIYGESFDESALEKVRAIPDVKDAQLRTGLTGKMKEYGQAQTEIFLLDESEVSKPYYVSGEKFDPEAKDALWLNQQFADAWDIKVGDELTVTWGGLTIEKRVAGLILSPEFIYMRADSDTDTDYHNIAYVYMGRQYFLTSAQESDALFMSILSGDAKNLFDAIRKSASGETVIPYTQIVFTTDREDVLSLEEEIKEALGRDYAVFIGRSSILGIKVFSDEINQHEQFSVVFAGIFLLISVLIIMTSMRRIVDHQRTQIGTMNAMGVKRWKIALHYVSFSFAVSLAGSAAGIVLGPVFGKPFTDLFSSWYWVPNWRNALFDVSYLYCVGAVVLLSSLAAYFSCRRLLKVEPAAALRPAPPKAGKRTLFEHLPFWNRLSFNNQYNLRDISRSKLRTVMSVVGIACGMMFMVSAFACRTTVDRTLDWNFSKLSNYSSEIILADDADPDKAEELADRLDGELVMGSGIEAAADEDAFSGSKETTSLYVIEGKGLFGISDTNTELKELSPGTVAVTSKLADKLGLSEGDTIYWHIYEKNDWHASTIGVINRTPAGSGITILREDFEAAKEDYQPGEILTNEEVSRDDLPGKLVSAVHSKEDLRESFMESMEAIYMLVLFFVVFSALFVLIVLYNSGNLSFSERIKEFATLKVLGLTSQQIRHILTVQSVWVTIAGVIIGAPLGKQILQYMFDSNGDSFDYRIFVSVTDYLVAGAFVVLISMLVGFFFNRRIRRLDMVGVLKGME